MLSLTPKSNIPFQGIRFPVKRCGNFMGKMTASFKASFAPSRPATSDHLTQGFSTTIAPSSLACNFFFSGSSESLSLSLFLSLFLGKMQRIIREKEQCFH
jgi:hypothetical protein